MSNTPSTIPVLTSGINKKIDLFLEEHYHKSQKMAEKIINLRKTQVNNLQNLIFSTSRFSEIYNFIKNQAGKDINKKNWFHFAQEMLDQLEALEKKAQEILETDQEALMEIKLKLAQGWIKQVASHYLYKEILNGNEDIDENR